MRKDVRKRNNCYLCRINTVNMSVRFTLEKRTNAFGECPIRVSWSFGGQRYQTTMGFSIKEVDWDEVKRQVKAQTRSYKGQSSDDINYYIKRVGVVVAGIEQRFVGDEKALTKEMMRCAISDALDDSIARPEDIIERCLEGIVSLPTQKTRYYRDLTGRYYKYLCDAKHKYIQGDSFYILQQLFGRCERIAVPSTQFQPVREKGSRYPILYYKEVSYEEAFGR